MHASRLCLLALQEDLACSAVMVQLAVMLQRKAMEKLGTA